LLAERPLLRDPASSEYILGPDPGTPRRVHVKLTAGATRRWLEEKISRFGFKAEPTTETNVVRVTIASAISALDLLAWSDQDQAIFTALEAACQRPHAWIEGDYTDPIGAPIFNFVSVRIVVQALAARAKAQLLLNRPDAALHDLTLVARLMGYLRESGSSIVVGMVYVAIGGLYGDAVAEGLSPGLWAEAELAALEPQMRDLDLLGTYANSLRGGERAAIIHVLEVLGAGRLADSFTSATQAPSLDPFALYLRLAPRGWLSQNLLRYARLHQYALDSIDLARGRVDPRRAEVARTAVEQEVGRWSVYNRVACVVIPNTAKALPVTARNHNLLQQARVVCALVRYRRASGAYPDSLASLVPRYFEKPPLDVMTGQPLKYRRLEGGQFTLYSVGWDVKDDGGKQTGSDEAQGQTGDWVWDRGAR
jgi:hypothetical protein